MEPFEIDVWHPLLIGGSLLLVTGAAANNESSFQPQRTFPNSKPTTMKTLKWIR